MFSQPLFVEVDTIFRNLVLCKLKKKHAVVLCCNSSSGGLKCTCNATWQTFLFRRINLNPSSLGELVASFSLQNRMRKISSSCQANSFCLSISVKATCGFNQDRLVWEKCPSLQSSSSPPQTSMDVGRADLAGEGRKGKYKNLAEKLLVCSFLNLHCRSCTISFWLKVHLRQASLPWQTSRDQWALWKMNLNIQRILYYTDFPASSQTVLKIFGANAPYTPSDESDSWRARWQDADLPFCAFCAVFPPKKTS